MSVHRLSRATLLITGRVEQVFTEKGIYLRRTSYSDVALGALLRGACRTSRAIVSLAQSGYGAATLALARSVIDSWITIRWLTNKDTDSRTRRFLAFDSKLRERIIQLIGTHYPTVDLRRYGGNKRHDRQALEFKKWSAWGPGIKDMAKETEEFDGSLTGAASPTWTYDIPFFISSYYLHPTSLGLNHHLQKPGETFNFDLRLDEDKMAGQGLMSTVQCVMLSGLRVAHFWGLDVDDMLICLWDRYIHPINAP